MKSPFPGLDPYLEPFWNGVHTSLIVGFCNQIQAQLPPSLWADIEEMVIVDTSSGNGLDALERTERAIRICDTTTGNRLITAVELLSPSNKTGTDNRASYIAHRDAYLKAGANLVEIDLLRSGEYISQVPLGMIRSIVTESPLITVYRHYRRHWEVYPVSLRDPLPSFCVPLRPGDRDIILQMQPAFDGNYRNGGYAKRIDYCLEPDPPFTAEDAAWADERLREQGLRK